MPRRPKSLIAHAPLSSVSQMLRTGVLPVSRYVAEACDRIEQFDGTVRAMLPEPGRRVRLLAEADALTARYPEPAGRPPLYGALVAVKDIIAVDGLPTRAGSALPPEEFAAPEATVITRLREAGALLLGKSVTTEFAYFDPGATTNPHDPDRTPGGSSSGSAAAVAAGYALLALGSQTVGSVIRPAAFCGVVGFKPTYGRVPTDGVLYYSPSVDHVGWFTQDAAGARIAAEVLVDGWPSDDLTRERVSREQPVLGVPEGPYLQQADAKAIDVFEATLRQVQASGIEVRRVPVLEDIEEITARHRWVATAEFGEQHAQRFARYGSLYRGMSAALVDAAGDITSQQRRAGVEGRGELRDRLHAAMDEHGIDAWVAPAATGPAPRGLRSTGDPAMNLPWTHAGLPAVTIPAGTLDGLPLGLQLAGRAHADELLLAWAEALEVVV